MRDIDEVNHVMSCDECNEAALIIDDIKLLIAWLAKLEESAKAAGDASQRSTRRRPRSRGARARVRLQTLPKC